jgi:hypothetical protein
MHKQRAAVEVEHPIFQFVRGNLHGLMIAFEFLKKLKECQHMPRLHDTT